MVKNRKKIELILFYSEEIESLFMSEVIRQVLGMHKHQAMSCVHLLEMNGVLVIRTLLASEKQKAEALVCAFDEQGIVAKLRYK